MLAYCHSCIFKTATGRLEFESVTASTMIKAGPIAATVADAALAYLAMAKPKEDSAHTTKHFYSSSYGVGGPPPAHLGHLGALPSTSIKGKRIGVFWPMFQDSAPAVASTCQRALDRLVAASGVELVPIAIPNVGWLRLAHGAITLRTDLSSRCCPVLSLRSPPLCVDFVGIGTCVWQR